MTEYTVSTREQLKAAQEAGIGEIVVVGELADKLKTAKKVATIGAGTAAVLALTLGAATVTAPVTGGLSYFAAAPVAAMTGIEISAIIAASALGIGLILALFLGYEEISFSKGRLVLRKKSK
jgi:hypothetical protein